MSPRLRLPLPPRNDPPALTRRPAFARLELAANLVKPTRCKARAEVAELADAHGSGPCTRKGVEVQVLSSAPEIQQTKLQRPGQTGLCRVWAVVSQALRESILNPACLPTLTASF